MTAHQTPNSSAGYEIRVELLKYLRGDTTLEVFAGRFTDLLWRLSDDDPDAQDFAYEIELRLAELSNGHWSEAEFRNMMRPIANTHRVSVHRGPFVLHTGTSAAERRENVVIALGEQFAGTARDMALS